MNIPKKWSDFDRATRPLEANDFFLVGNADTGEQLRVNAEDIAGYLASANVYFTFNTDLAVTDSMCGKIGLYLANTANTVSANVTINGDVRNGFQLKLIQVGANGSFSLHSANLAVTQAIANSAPLTPVEVLRVGSTLIVAA